MAGKIQAEIAVFECSSGLLARRLIERGMLDDTLVIWGGKFGRTSMGENRKSVGRDHHIEAFTMWMASADFKQGYIHGQSDQLGFDHEQLTSRFQGSDFRLTDVHGKIVKEMPSSNYGESAKARPPMRQITRVSRDSRATGSSRPILGWRRRDGPG